MFIQEFLLWGWFGITIEFIFTTIYSLFNRHWKLMGHSYGWMFPLYGAVGMIFQAIGAAVQWPFYYKALIYLPLIYGIEALSGILISQLTRLLQKFFGGAQGGIVPWKYTETRWAPFGLVNFKYLPFWAILALCFPLLSAILSKFVAALSETLGRL